MIRLAVDEMLGRLVPWLRALGLDVEYLAPIRLEPGLTKAERRRRAVIHKRLTVGDRVLVTKSTGLTIGRTVRIDSDNLTDQITETVRALGLTKADMNPLSRCLRCNSLLKDISREEATPWVPDYILTAQARFKGCPDCGRVYWPGTHHCRMMDKINQITAASS